MRMHVLAVHKLIRVQQKQHSGLQGRQSVLLQHVCEFVWTFSLMGP